MLLEAVAASQGGVFLTRQALAAGYDEQEIARFVRRGEWIRLRRGAYCTAQVLQHDPTADGLHRLTVRAAVLAMQRPCVVSHLSAAAWRHLPLYEADLALVHLTRTELPSTRTEGGVQHHAGQLRGDDVEDLSDVRVTSLGRTVVDVALEASFETALVVAEGALQRGLSPAELRAQLERVRDWPGARQVGRVVELAAPGAETVGETLMHLRFHEAGLPVARRQVEFRRADGSVWARVDGYFEEQRTIVEFDGQVKYDDPAVLWKEKLREDRLRSLENEFVRITWADLFDAAALGARVRAAFARAADRAWPGSPGRSA